MRDDPSERGPDPDEGLQLRDVVQLGRRCLPLLREVRGPLLALALAAAGLALLLVPAIALLFDVIWTRVLQGQPLTPLEAWILRVDPALGVEPALLSPELRREIARRVVAASVVGTALVVPCVLALVYGQTWLLQRIHQRLRERLFERFQTLSLRFHADSRVGDAIYRLNQDSAMVTQLIDVLFITPGFAIARLVFGVAVVAAFDPVLALVLLGLALPLVAIAAWAIPRLRRGFRGAREAQSALVSRVQETLAGIRVLKAHGAEREELARFEADSRRAFAAARRARGLYALYGVGLFAVVGAGAVATSASTALDARLGDPLFAARLFGLAGLAAWNIGLWNVFKQRFGDGAGALRALMRTWARAQDVGVGLDRTFEILDLEPEVQDAPDAIDLAPLRHGVRYEGVAFAYAPERPTLHDVHFEARAGAITAIVGPTGSGKSTLLALLLRLFDPAQGAITIDGVDLRRLRLASLRANVAIALQENLLFGATIRENLCFAAPGASEDAIWEALRVACLDDLVARLPDGLDTRLGERGTKLSTGQRQRLSIARALLKDAPILVLDEPTASLDAETEMRVLQRLGEWGRERAVLVVTHRLSTIRRADWIVCLQDGCIAEQGTHAALVAREAGLYRRLVAREEAGLASEAAT